jgi:GNAT superfamily N-acetyltransferase
VAGEVTVAEDRTVVVYAASSPAELDQARDLLRAYVTWHRQRHLADQGLIDRYFGTTRFGRELAGLPGRYAPPAGRLLLAGSGGVAVGCVALRRIDDQSCEMKRMFVSPAAQGRGVGRALGNELIRAARAEGYSSMYLDTSTRQTEARSLYRSLGFAEVEPYYETPQELRGWLVFMRLDLSVPA